MSNTLSDISRAIQCLSDPSASEHLKGSAMNFLDQVKSGNDAWSLCMGIIMSDLGENFHSIPQEKVQILFWALQTLTNYFKQSIQILIRENQLERVQNAFMQWFEVVGFKYNLPPVLRTKFSVALATLFKMTYPENWKQFFPQLFSILQGGKEVAIDYFLRVLKAIDEEVVEKHIHRSTAEIDRNQLIKDSMRDDSIQNIARAFFMILQMKHSELTLDCLDILPNYVDWAPIQLFTTDEFADTYLNLMNDKRFRCKVCDCLARIALKGMKHHEEKLALFQKLKYEELLTNLQWNSEEDLDFACSFSLLANNAASQILEAWLQFLESDQNKAQATYQMLMRIQPIMLRLVSDSSEQVSENVLQYFVAYVSIFKTKPISSEHDIQLLKQLFGIIHQKCKYPIDFNFYIEDQTEYDVGFLEYRKELLSLYSALIRYCDQVKEWLFPILDHTIQHSNEMHWSEVEVVLTLFSHAILNKPREANDPNSSFFPRGFHAIVCSRISSIQNPGVQYSFFDVFWRCSNYLQHDSTLIKPMLDIFVDERGMKNPFPMIRSRARYLFLNFMKVAQNKLASYCEILYENVKEFMRFELITQPIDPQSTLTREKYNLYEAIGSLLSNPNSPPENVKSVLFKIISPILDQITEILTKELFRQDTVEVPAFQNFIAENIGAITYLTKPFPADGSNVFICEELSRVFVVLRHVITKLPNSDIVRSRIAPFIRTASFAISLPQIMKEVLPLLETFQNITNSVVTTQEFVDLLQPLPYKVKHAKNEAIAHNFHALLIPLLAALTSRVSEYLGNNYWIDLTSEVNLPYCKLHKSYLLLIEAITIHGFVNALTADSNQFLTMLNITLRTLLHPQPYMVRSDLTCFKCLINALVAENPTFTKFCLERVLPACFELPMSQSFELEDASWNLVLGDIIEVLKLLAKNTGDEFVRYSMQVLSSHGWNQDQGRELLNALTIGNKIGSQRTFSQIFKQRKGK